MFATIKNSQMPNSNGMRLLPRALLIRAQRAAGFQGHWHLLIGEGTYVDELVCSFCVYLATHVRAGYSSCVGEAVGRAKSLLAESLSGKQHQLKCMRRLSEAKVDPHASPTRSKQRPITWPSQRCNQRSTPRNIIWAPREFKLRARFGLLADIS